MREGERMVSRAWLAVFVLAAAVLYTTFVSRKNPTGWSKEDAFRALREMSDNLGLFAIPLYVGIHTISLALCLPYAIFFEAGASLLFGFLPGVICVFAAKLLGASLSFWIGRLILRSSSSAMQWTQRSKYFHLLARGVAKDGWRFVLMARFSPIPSYIINYALAATDIRFLFDFLLPTVIGCIPMILQNTSVGSLAGAAIASTSSSKKSHILSYILPLLGIVSSVLISWRVKNYSSQIAVIEDDMSSRPHSDATATVKNSAKPQILSDKAGLKQMQ